MNTEDHSKTDSPSSKQIPEVLKTSDPMEPNEIPSNVTFQKGFSRKKSTYSDESFQVNIKGTSVGDSSKQSHSSIAAILFRYFDHFVELPTIRRIRGWLKSAIFDLLFQLFLVFVCVLTLLIGSIFIQGITLPSHEWGNGKIIILCSNSFSSEFDWSITCRLHFGTFKNNSQWNYSSSPN